MRFHTCLSTLFFISSLFVNTWGLKSESVIGDIENQVNPENYGYVVTLFIFNRLTTLSRHLTLGSCGAVIISEKFALTVAHCLKAQEWRYGIYAVPPNNSPEILRNEKNRNQYRVTDAYVYKQDDWKRIDRDYDIGAVKISGEFKPGQYFPNARVIDISETETNYAGVTGAEFLGSGQNGLGYVGPPLLYTNRNGRNDFTLRRSLMSIYSQNILYNTNAYKLERSKSVQCNKRLSFCAVTQYTEPFGVISPGDSGGPLIYDNKVIGLASKGPPYERGWKTITLFVNVAYHRNFITSITDGPFNNMTTDVYKYRQYTSDYTYYDLDKPNEDISYEPMKKRPMTSDVDVYPLKKLRPTDENSNDLYE